MHLDPVHIPAVAFPMVTDNMKTGGTHDEAALRLGDVLPYVKRVERFLVEEERIHPVFTG